MMNLSLNLCFQKVVMVLMLHPKICVSFITKKPLFFSYQKAVSASLPKSRANQKAVQVGTLLRSEVLMGDDR
jgi:hypothetical protein